MPLLCTIIYHHPALLLRCVIIFNNLFLGSSLVNYNYTCTYNFHFKLNETSFSGSIINIYSCVCVYVCVCVCVCVHSPVYNVLYTSAPFVCDTHLLVRFLLCCLLVCLLLRVSFTINCLLLRLATSLVKFKVCLTIISCIIINRRKEKVENQFYSVKQTFDSGICLCRDFPRQFIPFS